MQKSLRIGLKKRVYLLIALMLAAVLIAVSAAQSRAVEETPEGAVFAYSRAYIVRAEEDSLCA